MEVCWRFSNVPIYCCKIGKNADWDDISPPPRCPPPRSPEKRSNIRNQLWSDASIRLKKWKDSLTFEKCLSISDMFMNTHPLKPPSHVRHRLSHSPLHSTRWPCQPGRGWWRCAPGRRCQGAPASQPHPGTLAWKEKEVKDYKLEGWNSLGFIN